MDDAAIRQRARQREFRETAARARLLDRRIPLPVEVRLIALAAFLIYEIWSAVHCFRNTDCVAEIRRRLDLQRKPSLARSKCEIIRIEPQRVRSQQHLNLLPSAGARAAVNVREDFPLRPPRMIERARITEARRIQRSEEHTSELQSHSFISYAVFCLKKKKK